MTEEDEVRRERERERESKRERRVKEREKRKQFWLEQPGREWGKRRWWRCSQHVTLSPNISS